MNDSDSFATELTARGFDEPMIAVYRAMLTRLAGREPVTTADAAEILDGDRERAAQALGALLQVGAVDRYEGREGSYCARPLDQVLRGIDRRLDEDRRGPGAEPGRDLADDARGRSSQAKERDLNFEDRGSS